MKILICGKGGTGKSTLTALLARELAGRHRPVLVVDSDESNFGLPALLGMEKPRDFMEYFGGRKLLFERVKTLERGLKAAELPSEYVAEKNGVRLLAVGKIYDFGEGCACPINALAAKFLEKVELGRGEILIADTDAGVEHLGRGVERGCDLLLVVVEPSRESRELAARVAGMVRALGKEVFYILNRVDESARTAALGSLPPDRLLACIPFDRRIFQAGLDGGELSIRLEEISRIADFLGARTAAP
jgi:CO dehydrogenase maturation factor